MKKNCCIIPFYNEAKRIDLNKFKEAFSTSYITFCLVDDGSTDNTLQQLLDFEKQYSNVKVIANKKNAGKAEAIRNAMLQLNGENSFEYIGYFDCDFATPFSEYLRLQHLIIEQNCELIFGSRIKLYGKKIERNTSRHYLSRIFITTANLLCDLDIYDTQCGCKIFHKNIIPVSFQKKFLSKWSFDLEIFVRILQNNKNALLFEEGLYEWKEIGGSKIKLSDFMKFPFELLTIFFQYRWRNYGQNN